MVYISASVVILASISLLSHGFVSISQSQRSNPSIAMSVAINGELSELCLTPELEKYVTGFRNVADDKLRYQQLFFLASKCKPMEDVFKIEQNKVCHLPYFVLRSFFRVRIYPSFDTYNDLYCRYRIIFHNIAMIWYLRCLDASQQYISMPLNKMIRFSIWVMPTPKWRKD